ncbi:cysteine-rich CWC family protein [Variovorax sp. LT2P21]|uniref:cysteine-rich CWC family protein n=1 Tax=Variovorax sp. LT2P21 TaxID=3443731 RepID=UPI003F47A849
MPTLSTIDPARCPLCGETNACAMEIERTTGVAQGPCWCMTARFDQGLREQVPETARGLACICARCAAAADLTV